MQSRSIRLSPTRRLMIDMLALAASVPSIPARRTMELGRIAAVRNHMHERISWAAIFAKAYGRTAKQFPELRRAYVKLPWPHIREYPISVAMIAVERMIEGEPAVFFARIKKPEAKPIQLLAGLLGEFKDRPVEHIKDFRRLLAVARIPWPLRRLIMWFGMNYAPFRGTHIGTFGLTTVGALDTELLHPRGPTSTILTFGPISDDGTVEVAIIFDHRVVDGATVARAMQRLEETLNGEMLAELEAIDCDTAASKVAAE